MWGFRCVSVHHRQEPDPPINPTSCPVPSLCVCVCVCVCVCDPLISFCPTEDVFFSCSRDGGCEDNFLLTYRILIIIIVVVVVLFYIIKYYFMLNLNYTILKHIIIIIIIEYVLNCSFILKTIQY